MSVTLSALWQVDINQELQSIEQGSQGQYHWVYQRDDGAEEVL